MSLIDKHFKDALKNLPGQKLSWSTDRRIKKSIRQRAAELDGKQPFWVFLRKMAAAPLAFMLLIVSTGGYAYASPSVVQGDLLYPVKSELESLFYPESAASSQRVAYHLWLSQRRYAEVEEILQRRSSGQKLAFAAYAQSLTVNPLDESLVKTLERATQNVEYAFLVLGEITELNEVKIVKDEIRKTIATQKIVLEQATPVLKEVKFTQKQKARKTKVKQEVVPKQLAEALEIKDAEIVELSAETESSIGVSELSVPQNPLNRNLELDGASQEIKSSELFLESTDAVVEIELEDEVEDAAGFLVDRLAFQEELLATMDKDVSDAEVLGVAQIELRVNKKLEDYTEEDVKNDKVFAAALAVHFNEKKNTLKKDLEDLDKVLVAELEDGDSEDVDDLELSNDQLSEFSESSKSEEEPPVSPVEVEEPEEVIIAAVDPVVEADPSEDADKNLEEEVLSIVSVDTEPSDVDKELEEKVSVSAMIKNEELEEERSVAAVSEEVEEIETVTDDERSIEDTELAADTVNDPLSFGVMSGVSSTDPKPELLPENDQEEVDLELIIKRCKEAIGLLCSEFTIEGCQKRGNDQCLSVKSPEDLELLLKNARKSLNEEQAKLDARVQQDTVKLKIQETRDQLIEIDTKIQRLEGSGTR